MRVKICGITRLEDALTAVEAGADALGFVFYEDSPRYIAPQKAREIIDALPPFVERVGLFVNEGHEQINRICREARISTAQIHFDTEPCFLDLIDVTPLPVVRVQQPGDLGLFADRYRLVDAFVEGYGGAGKRLPLAWFEDFDCSRMILAGGLSSEILHEVKPFGFYGVDVSSGVEREKGIKDRAKVEAFIAEAKR